MINKHTEERLEDAIEAALVGDGNSSYENGSSGDYDPELGLEPQAATEFIRATQATKWDGLEAIHGAETNKMVLAALTKHLN